MNKIESDEIHILFGKYVLLGDKTKAQIYFKRFSDEDQSRYKGFPIYKLYIQLWYIGEKSLPNSIKLPIIRNSIYSYYPQLRNECYQRR